MKFFYQALVTFFFLLPVAWSAESKAQSNPLIQFPWGEELNSTEKLTDLNLKIGFRLQTAVEFEREEKAGNTLNTNDFYARRLRFQFQGNFLKNYSYYMDIRNDQVNKDNNGEGNFTIGDAYITFKNIFGDKNIEARFMRAKVDISRTQTLSSAKLLFHDRSPVTDFAADYVSEGRRAANIQMNAKLFEELVHLHLVVGDGVQSGSFQDTFENSAGGIDDQGLLLGGKIKVSPHPEWKDNLSETPMGRGQHLTLGYGYFTLDNIQFKRSSNTITESQFDRRLHNFEFSFHYGPVSFISEFFLFENMILNINTPFLTTAQSKGGYIALEWFFSQFYNLAPYIRLSSWDRFKGQDYREEERVFGLNYYVKENKIKFGVHHTRLTRGKLLSINGFNAKESRTVFTSQWHY